MRINWLNIVYSFITVAQSGSLNIYIFWNHIHFLLNFFQTGLAHWLNLNPIYFFWFFIFSTSLQSSNSDLQSLIIPSKQNPQAASESDLHTEAMWDSLPVDIIPLVLIRLPVKSIITLPLRLQNMEIHRPKPYLRLQPSTLFQQQPRFEWTNQIWLPFQ